MQKPLVSIIVASYNKEAYVQETLDSVLKQTLSDWELVIVDDASTDATVGILKANAEQDPRIRIFLNTENRGANHCRNQGIREALGQYLIFLDADDVLIPSCLQNRVEQMQRRQDLDFAVFTVGVFRKHPGDLEMKWMPDSRQPLNDFLAHKLPWNILQPIWKREFVKQLDGFDVQFPRLQDVEFHTRALLIPDVVYELRGGAPDSYYRIDEERKNYNTYTFLNRWVTAAKMYYMKFYPLAETQKRQLSGTLYQAYLQLLWNYRSKKLTLPELKALEKVLFDSEIRTKLGSWQKLIFKLGRMINMLPFRVPGINFILDRLVRK